MTADYLWLWIGIVAAAILGVLLWLIWRKGRLFAPGNVFRASRLSSGNRLLPTQVLITPTTVVQYTPQWIGRLEESINMAHVSSVKIDTGMMFSDVFIETSGGSDPIKCHGHRKSDAIEMKKLIERHQTEYYQTTGRPRA